MLTIGSLPSLRSIAATIVSGDESGQLVLFSFPSREIWVKWKDSFLEAMDACLSERGRGVLYDGIITMDPDSSNPLNDLAEKLAVDMPLLNEILVSYSGEPPIVLELDCKGRITDQWQSFLTDLARYYRTHESVYSKRSICLFLSSPHQLPPIETAPGVRCFSFWNPLQWEEVRLYFDKKIGQVDNPIVKSWLVSTYTGAANSDPDIIAELLQSEPRTLRDVRTLVKRYCDRFQHNKEVTQQVSSFIAEKKWEVPLGASAPWLNCQLYGHSLTRGGHVPWEMCSSTFLRSTLDRAIWRELVAGLYPLLMEITAITSEIITQQKGREWRELMPAQDDETSFDTEPGEILNIFYQNKSLGMLPQKIYQLLQQLRLTRNRLAHLEPVDYSDVNQVWSLFDRVARNSK